MISDAGCGGKAFARDGFAVIEGVLSREEVEALAIALERVGDTAAVRRRGGIFAVRNLLEVSEEVRALASADSVLALVKPIVGDACFAVRGILFDKVPGANWMVPWHQDVTIAVEAEGFGAWSVKAGVVHVQAPAAVLEGMVSVRLHLDDCGEENGALRVIAGSHRRGRIDEEQIEQFRGAGEVVCAVQRGGVLLMRPLLLHASSASRKPGHRRVVHLDYAAVALPGGMRWLSVDSREGA